MLCCVRRACLQLYKTLKRFADAEVGLLDAWRLTIDAPSAQLFHELPHCLQLNKDAGSRQVRGPGAGGRCFTACS